MQRQLWVVKSLSKIPRNYVSCSSTTNWISPSSSPIFLKTNIIGNPFYHYQQSFSQHSTLSHSKIWRLCRCNGVGNNGFSSSPIMTTTSFFSKGQNKFPANAFLYSLDIDSPLRGCISVFRRLAADGAAIGLVIANVVGFMLWRVAEPQFMVNNFMISVDNFTSGRLHTLITCAFSHKDKPHLISNMVGLYIFGLNIEKCFGPQYLLKLYLSGAIVGSIFYLAYHGFIAPSFQSKQGIDHSRIAGLGASGAVNAILLLDIFLFPVPFILLGMFIIGKDFLRTRKGDHEVSASAHLGGATVAAWAWAWGRRARYGRF